MWEIGIKLGALTVSGDVASQFLTFPNFGIHVRKAFGYVFSARLNYMYGYAKGLNWLPSGNYSENEAWTQHGYTGIVYYNYKTNIQDLSLEGLFSLNNIRFHKSKVGINVYGLVGIGGSLYDAKVNALNAQNQPYNFASIVTLPNTHKNRGEIRDQLKDAMDDTYETAAEDHGERRPKLFGMTYKTVGHFGGGIAFKLSNRLNIALEDRFTFTNDDLYDGQRWAEQTGAEPVLTQNYDTYNFLSLGLNINLGSRAVQPLWWLNPLDYAYQELRKPRLMILPKPVLPDADGDGVTDQFDQEQ
ncbi:MAG TPA: hypothetical protein VFZ78_09555, partial [Flavisolibacter sp.]